MLRFLFFTLLFFLLSCTQNREDNNNNSPQPAVVPACGYVVPIGSMAEPKVILVDESKLKKVPVGKFKVMPTNLNVHPAGKPKVMTGVRI